MNIVITGASKGIGLAIAEQFSADTTPHTFFLCSRNKASLTAAVHTLASRYPLHTYYGFECDVASEAMVTQFIAACHEIAPTIDILINNAGFGLFKPTEEMTASEFTSVLDTNLNGVFWMTKGFLPSMRKNKQGTIVTISSLAGKNGFKGGAAYCAAKYAVRGLMQCLFLEVRSDNIRCITVCPGSVDTAFFDTVKNPSNTATMLKASEVAAIIYHATLLPQEATVSEIEIRPTNPKGR